jgi:subtilisin-like proprotein convertase family protein
MSLLLVLRERIRARRVGGAGPQCARGTARAELLERRLLLATVSGRVFSDFNFNGVMDGPDSGMSGWTVYLDQDSDNRFDTGEPSTTTGREGAYTLALALGTNEVRVARPTGWAQTAPPSNGSHTVVILRPDSRDFPGRDFGVTDRGVVSGTKFNDRDRDAFRDSGESGLPGWTIYADTNNNGQLDPGETSAVTDAAGTYALNLVADAVHSIREVQQPGWIHTLPTGPQPVHQVFLAPGATNERTFGNYRTGSIAGRAYNDRNGDGTPSAGEEGTPGWTIYLDQNNNGALDTATAAQNAADLPRPIAHGSTSSRLTTSGLAGTILDVDVTLNISHPFDADLRVYLVGPSATRPGNQTEVELFNHVGGAGDNFTNTTLDDEAATPIAEGGAPFAGRYRPAEPLSTFDGGDPNFQWVLRVFDDAAANNGEITGWTLTLTYGDARRVTDAAGNYSFAGLVASGLFSGYVVRQVDRPGWVQTAPPAGFHTAFPFSTDVTGRDFGNARNDPPVVASLSDSPDPVLTGSSVTLTALGAADPDGDTTISGVTFYRESNGTPGLQTGADGDTALSTDGASPYSYTFPTTGMALGTYTYYAQAADTLGGTSNIVSTTNTIARTAVVARHVFYNRSAFDGNDPAASAQDTDAIATDKFPLLPGQSPSFANVTSYVRGINGLIVDIGGLPAGAALTTADFSFGAALRPVEVNVRRGAGASGTDRVTLIWTDYSPGAETATMAIANGWLHVTIQANANTGLAAPDVFSFGNLIAETGDRPTAGRFAVNVIDVARLREAMRRPTATISSAADFNRDRTIDARDLHILRANYGSTLAPPAASPALTASTPAAPVMPRTALIRRAAYDVLVGPSA